MHPLLESYSKNFEDTISHLRDELATMRIGRANPVLVENILVDAYGVKTPLKQLASITVPEARTLLIQPWDKNQSKDIEKAVIDAKIGLSPVNEGEQVRLTIPQLTEESRIELTKSVAEKVELCRISVRQLRDKIKDQIVTKERNKELTEDDKYDLQKKLDEQVKEYNEQIKSLGDKKEQEIMTL